MNDAAIPPLDAFRYDKVTVALHWLTVVLVALLWLGAQVIDWFPRGGGRLEARSVHIVLGVSLLGLLLLRFAWRKTPWGNARPPRHGLGDLAAHLMSWLLLLLVGLNLLLGLFNVAVRGDAVFDWFKVPPLGTEIEGLRDLVGEWHGWGGNLILAVAGVHAAAALVHHFVLRDDTLIRMRPGSSRAS